MASVNTNTLTKRRKKIGWGQIGLNTFFTILSVFYIVPIVMLISTSLEGSVTTVFSIIPKEFSIAAYQLLLPNMKNLIRAMGVTLFYSITGVALSLLVMLLMSYSLSRRYFKLRGILTFLLFFTTLFNGGLIGSYIVNASLLHLNDSIWIYILPTVVNAWNVIVIRTYLQGLPEDMLEAARIDGASEFQICFRIVAPLSKPVLASVGFLRFIDAWNNWWTCQIYIRKPELYSIQYMLQRLIDSIDNLEQMILTGMAGDGAAAALENLEAMRYATAVIAVLPVLFVFPFFQKYFAKGMTLGSVKG